jgi:hypothetical protein
LKRPGNLTGEPGPVTLRTWEPAPANLRLIASVKAGLADRQWTLHDLAKVPDQSAAESAT